jgi:hypothetical protein
MKVGNKPKIKDVLVGLKHRPYNYQIEVVANVANTLRNRGYPYIVLEDILQKHCGYTKAEIAEMLMEAPGLY